MTRLEELQAKEDRTPEEDAELERLQSETDNDVDDPDKDEEEFDAAFEDALAADDPDKDPDSDADADPDADSDDDDNQKKDSANADDGDEPKADDIFVAPDADADPDSDEDDKGSQDDDQKSELELAQEENSKLTQKMKSWEGRITAANKRADEAEQKLQELTDSTQDKENAKKKADELPDGEEDDQVLKDFIEEFPSLEKPIKAMAMKIARQVVETKLKDFEPKLEKIDRIEQSHEENVVKEHWNAIGEAHPDYEEIRDSGKLNEWIELQPSFVKDSLERVAKEGTAQEVVEMFDAYKKSTGHVTSSLTSTGKKSKKTKKAQDMSAVDGSPGGPKVHKGDIDKDDYDSAWADATSTQ